MRSVCNHKAATRFQPTPCHRRQRSAKKYYFLVNGAGELLGSTYLQNLYSYTSNSQDPYTCFFISKGTCLSNTLFHPEKSSGNGIDIHFSTITGMRTVTHSDAFKNIKIVRQEPCPPTYLLYTRYFTDLVKYLLTILMSHRVFPTSCSI